MIRCVAFDFDGTLVDSNAIKRDTFFRVVEDFEAGALLMDGILSREDAGDRYWIFEHFAAALNRSEIAHDLADRYTQLCERNIAAAPEIKGALKALKRLRNMGMELFVNSATPEVALKKIIDLRDLGPFFRACTARRRTRQIICAPS